MGIDTHLYIIMGSFSMIWEELLYWFAAYCFLSGGLWALTAWALHVPKFSCGCDRNHNGNYGVIHTMGWCDPNHPDHQKESDWEFKIVMDTDDQ